MEDEELDNIIVLNDENGNEVKFEFLDLVELDDEEYVVLLPVSEEGEEDEEGEEGDARVGRAEQAEADLDASEGGGDGGEGERADRL